jgi:hypothetical protein
MTADEYQPLDARTCSTLLTTSRFAQLRALIFDIYPTTIGAPERLSSAAWSTPTA